MLLSLTGCSYGHKYFPVTSGDETNEYCPSSPETGTKDYQIRIVQSDDFGSLWKRDDAEEALNLVETVSKENDTVVLLFIHGWHHNADSQDDNLLQFKCKVREVSQKLLKLHPGPADKISVIGIYVGWRGRSLPSFLDYATIWGRKDSAERVGEGDVSEFIARLNKIYKKHNASEINNNGKVESSNFMHPGAYRSQPWCTGFV